MHAAQAPPAHARAHHHAPLHAPVAVALPQPQGAEGRALTEEETQLLIMQQQQVIAPVTKEAAKKGV